MPESPSACSGDVGEWVPHGAEFLQRMMDELVVAHELGHAVVGEAVGMESLGFKLEFARNGASVAHASGLAPWRYNGVGHHGLAMALVAGTLAQDVWARLRGATDIATRRALFRDMAPGSAFDNAFLQRLVEERGVDMPAVVASTEEALDRPEVRSALRELVEDVMRDVPMRRAKPMQYLAPGEYIRQVLARHGVVRGMAGGAPHDAAARAAARRPAGRAGGRVPGVAQAVRAAAGRSALVPGSSAERSLSRSLTTPARPGHRPHTGQVTPAAPVRGR
ncbi:hypothetical protein ACFPZ0_06500 [Streptomonospora nanhaiensis]|uniref:hypothetical protein n=2 Tax=Streptomonospora nanhaiensis TaxID=1323731 RepID=UPI003613C471